MNNSLLPNHEPDDIEHRRKRLARTMMLHRARPSFIFQYTFLSRDRLQGLRERYKLPNTERPRGSSPHSIQLQIMRSPHMRDAAAAAAVLWILTSDPTDADLPQNLARLVRGEQLCASYEAFKAMVPTSRLTLEHLGLLTSALRGAEHIILTHCNRCDAATLNEPANLNTQPPICETCNSKEQTT